MLMQLEQASHSIYHSPFPYLQFYSPIRDYSKVESPAPKYMD